MINMSSMFGQKHRSAFQEEFPFEKRKQEAERILKKHPDRVPVIVEKAKKSQVPAMDNRKFLVPKDINISQFIWIIRRRIKLDPSQAIFLFANNTLPPPTILISQLYKEHGNEDKFLYLSYAGENTFGGK